MNRFSPATAIPGAAALLGVALLIVWTTRGTVGGLDLREPGMDRQPLLGQNRPARRAALPEVGQPVPGDGKPSAVPGAWPCFRGPDRDGICRDGVPLARKWPAGGPPLLWQIELGPGHAGAAVAGGRVFVLDYDVKAQADTMRCLSLDDGREIWHNSYPVEVPENHGMSRTVAAVADDCVVSLGPKCHVACWDVKTGRCRWLIDLVGQYGATVPPWYAGQCPLVEDGRVILAPAGSSLVIAVDLKTGEVVWRSPKVRNWTMTHVSILPTEFGGKRTYVYCASGGVAAVSADDGSLLWQTPDWVGRMATCPTPVPLGGGRLFCSGGYGAGSVILQVNQQDGRSEAHAARRLSARQFGSEQQTPILFGDHLYAVRTKPGSERLVCLDLEGNEVWNSGKDVFGRGPYLIAGGMIYVMDDRGVLTLAEATPAGYKWLARAEVLADGHDSWGPMAMVAGRLIVRDLTRMACLDVGKR
jgi:outer membrane protein assembly factor BamB